MFELTPLSIDDTLGNKLPFGKLELTVSDGIIVDTFDVIPRPRVSFEVIPFLRKTGPAPRPARANNPSRPGNPLNCAEFTSLPPPAIPITVNEGLSSEPGFQ
jgi:hypothetical protein